MLSDTVVYSAIPYEKIKAYMFLRRSLVHITYMYMISLRSVHLGACPPPPHTQKLATLLLPAFAHQKSGQMKMADSVPPTRYTKSPPLMSSLGKRRVLPVLLVQLTSNPPQKKMGGGGGDSNKTYCLSAHFDNQILGFIKKKIPRGTAAPGTPGSRGLVYYTWQRWAHAGGAQQAHAPSKFWSTILFCTKFYIRMLQNKA